MHLRIVAAAAVAFSLLGADAALAQREYLGDADGRYSGGQPGGKRYELFGGMSYVGAIRRQTVSAPGNYAPGTIIVNTSERRLYLIQDGGTALKYGIGVGRIGFTWAGTTSVVAKKEWPDWTPPSQMLKRRPDLPRFMKGGSGESARRARDVSRLLALSHPRLERAGDDRTGRVVGMLPPDERRRDRSLRSREGRREGHRDAVTRPGMI